MSLALIHPEMSYNRLLEEWIKEKRTEIKRLTLSRYQNKINVHIKNSIGEFAIEEIDKDVLQDYLDELEEKIPDQNSTIKDVFLIIRSSLERAVEVGIINNNPANEVEPPKQQLKDNSIVIWDKKQVKMYLNAVSEHANYIAMYLALKEGWQQGEILALRWEDIDFTANTVTISKILSHDGKEIIDRTLDDSSDSKVRKIKFSRETHEELKKVLRKQEASDNNNPLDLVLVTSNGTPVLARNLLRVHHRYCEKLGFSKTSFAELRHTYTLLSLKEGINPIVLTEKLGFADMRYLKTYEEHLTLSEKERINNVSFRKYGRNIFALDV